MYCGRRLNSLAKRGVEETMTAPQHEMALYSLFDVSFPRVRENGLFGRVFREGSGGATALHVILKSCGHGANAHGVAVICDGCSSEVFGPMQI